MLNYLWGAMLLIGIIIGILGGKVQEISNSAISSAKEAVTLCITMLGVMSLWTGLMQIAQKAGIITSLTRKITPFLRFLLIRFHTSAFLVHVSDVVRSNVMANSATFP